MEAFPAFFPLTGRRIIIAGEGDGAEAKARLLAGSPATVERVTGGAALARGAYIGAVLAFVASPDADFCRQAAAAAKNAGVPVNVVDHPELCDFHTPAIIDRGQVVAAIGTAGAAPMVSAVLRAELEARIPERLGQTVQVLGDLRDEIRARFPDLAQRRAFLRDILNGPVAEAPDRTTAEGGLRDALAASGPAAGCVWLIGEPASRDLLTLRAARALSAADVLVLADPAKRDIAVLARRDAAWRTLKDVDAEFMAQQAAEGRQVAVIAPPGELIPLAVVLTDLGAPHEAIAAAPA
jgi:precorrin-2 dehydrogenase/sirohydrochlorin ferrochelatase